jgi:SAM-dependent methyltransferase
MQFTTNNLRKRLVNRLGRFGIRLGTWGDWQGLEAPIQHPRYSNIEAWRIKYKLSGSVIDVGCGSGIVLRRIHETALPHIRYCGIDRSRSAIALAQFHIADRQLESFIRCDIKHACKLIKEKFDLIIFNEGCTTWMIPSQ